MKSQVNLLKSQLNPINSPFTMASTIKSHAPASPFRRVEAGEDDPRGAGPRLRGAEQVAGRQGARPGAGQGVVPELVVVVVWGEQEMVETYGGKIWKRNGEQEIICFFLMFFFHGI